LNRVPQPLGFHLVWLDEPASGESERLLIEENRILKEMLGGKRIRFTDHERRAVFSYEVHYHRE
jgi:hypothetical protein